MREHSSRLKPYLRRYAPTDADEHDLLQDVWLRAFQKRRTFDGRGSFIGWLLMVSRTVGMAAVGKRSREPPAVALPVDALTSDPDVHLLYDVLRAAVLALPARQRDVVLLRLVEDRTTAETALLLACAEGTVKATLHHATRRLQELLKENVQ